MVTSITIQNNISLHSTNPQRNNLPDLTLELKLLNNITILPSDLRGQTAENAECTSGAKTEYTEGVRDDHALSLVIRRRDTLEDLKTGKSLLTTNSLVGNHTADSAPEDLGGRSQVEGSSLGVDVATLAQERVVVVLVLLEDTRDLHLLATNNNLSHIIQLESTHSHSVFDFK